MRTPHPAHLSAASQGPTLSRRALLSWGGTLAAASLARRALPVMYRASGEAPTIAELTTPDGRLRGRVLPEGIRTFRGIRFAEPPTGTLRFKHPVPVRPWTGVRDALTFGPAARQPHEDGIAQSEDCLFLNVWTPSTPGPHPVFVWIHGGGYTGGTSFAPVFDGVSFARGGIVLVSVAYRLGVFGFLDLGPLLGASYSGSANNGTRDVLESLRWVQRNIAAFGGDPGRVTVGGESAGAKLTATLMALPEAQPLFQSAISESGGGERVLTRDQAAGVARRFAEQWQRLSPERTGRGHQPRNDTAAGNTSGPLSSFFTTLLSADAADLLTAQERTIAASPLHFPFRPQIDGPAEGSLLRGRPVDLVAQGSARGKRLLIGTDRDESALFLGPHPERDPTDRDLGNLPVEKFSAVLARYATLYPDLPADFRRIRATSAEEYWVPSIRLADAQSRNSGPTWMYRLDFSPSTGRFAGESAHASDLNLVWDHLSSQGNVDPATAALAQSMHAAWCAFIRGEAPAAPGLPTWPAYNADTRPTMLLDSTSRVEDRPAEAELRLWDGVL